jgi:processive 1,2-diacylglycerol beta-glucosyltransferase
VVTFLTDFGVHPLWVHPAVDLHLAVSATSAALATRHGARSALCPGPLVADRFRPDSRIRTETRRRLGIEEGARVVLVVAGSWGVGHIEATVAALRASGTFHPVVVCGCNPRFEAALRASGKPGTILGWTDEMPALMAAADALVENAGGLTALEAFAAGVPVVSFAPIPGHGRDNARQMARAGVSRYARSRSELYDALTEVTPVGLARQRMIAKGRAIFCGDPTDEIVALATANCPGPVRAPGRLKGRRRVALAACAVAVLYAGATAGTDAVAAAGIGIAKAPAGQRDSVYLGVRVNAAELANPSVVSAIRRARATLVVDGTTATRTRPNSGTVAGNVDVGSAGAGQHHTFPWSQAHDDCRSAAHAIANSTRARPHELVVGDVNAFHQLYCHTGPYRQRIVRVHTTFDAAAPPAQLIERRVYLFDGRSAGPTQVESTVARFRDRATRARLVVRPLRDLR